MKKIAFFLALCLTLLALSSCVNSLGTENTDSLGADSKLSMTIAKTRPSCVAFEEREPNEPNCFYAYDNEGNFYRVLWSEFEGLNEKDRIVVEYSDLKELFYEEHFYGGYTPKYELTATSVQLERDGLASCISYEDGKYTLTFPQSGDKLGIREEMTRFVPYITDELVEAAEKKIAEETSEYDNRSLYLWIKDDYLCLSSEVIRKFDKPDKNGDDHEHIFFYERITDRALPKAKEDILSSAIE